jgi:uncharacterized protein YutE (UPF0331/DUF86 family)
MTLNLVVAKLADIASRLRMVTKHRKPNVSDYVAEPEARDLVAFNLMLAVQSAADLATHIIGGEGLVPVRTVAESFERIAEASVISPQLAARLRKAVGFRNGNAHGNAKRDLEGLSRAAGEGVADLESFVQEVAAWAQERYA